MLEMWKENQEIYLASREFCEQQEKLAAAR